MSYIRKTLLTSFAIASVLAVVQVPTAKAQEPAETIVGTHIVTTPADATAAENVKASSYHVMASSLPGAKESAAALNLKSELGQAADGPHSPLVRPGTLVAPYFYPGDLAKGSGSTLQTAVSHAVYVDFSGTVAANWGNPEGFLSDLGQSTFIHLTDQYTGATTNGRYTVGANAEVRYGFFGNTLYQSDMWAIAHAVASKSGYGSGDGKIYHIFLPKGIDTCFDQSTSCYSPDNNNHFDFCAYHGWVTFSDIGLVLFTVQPYQLVPGCEVATPSPNGQLADSTNSVLSHELFETITDPIVGSGYLNRIDLDLRGYEIGDECQPLDNSTGGFLVPTFLINKKKYEVQIEYSNTYHACAAQP